MYDVTEAADIQLERYPGSTLRDIYKSFFQDEFGPGHIIESPEQAGVYLEQELAAMKSRKRQHADLCGAGCNFCRLSLDLIVDGIISTEDYLSGFIRGATAESIISYMNLIT